MSGYRIQAAALVRLEDIYRYTLEQWGEAQAERYIRGLFARFEAIADRQIPWRPVPAEFGVEGFVGRYEHHLIYWRALTDGDVGIVTVLHERMHQISRFRDDFGP
ncbi:MAG: type II toxin-antitoxin system RelE/ParE family toxin [Phenylobacterium sp.]|uniref:type II toxin-antitoxin system RelE/ParE family toxin n=1 Tax=Phenylobacterium sp. TaxID=1871053 RepID=UPI0025DABD96|nr:type II toxin-antitoxin system RelE/ParE family toxin [Phenylobacterium sp.]MCG9917168.1 type II toxin-antitoxin system RelE/ParE family toxin [Phenylobacterium sp.]